LHLQIQRPSLLIRCLIAPLFSSELEIEDGYAEMEGLALVLIGVEGFVVHEMLEFVEDFEDIELERDSAAASLKAASFAASRVW
jgi:hypothetical protein